MMEDNEMSTDIVSPLLESSSRIEILSTGVYFPFIRYRSFMGDTLIEDWMNNIFECEGSSFMIHKVKRFSRTEISSLSQLRYANSIEPIIAVVKTVMSNKWEIARHQFNTFRWLHYATDPLEAAKRLEFDQRLGIQPNMATINYMIRRFQCARDLILQVVENQLICGTSLPISTIILIIQTLEDNPELSIRISAMFSSLLFLDGEDLPADLKVSVADKFLTKYFDSPEQISADMKILIRDLVSDLQKLHVATEKIMISYGLCILGWRLPNYFEEVISLTCLHILNDNTIMMSTRSISNDEIIYTFFNRLVKIICYQFIEKSSVNQDFQHNPSLMRKEDAHNLVLQILCFTTLRHIPLSSSCYILIAKFLISLSSYQNALTVFYLMWLFGKLGMEGLRILTNVINTEPSLEILAEYIVGFSLEEFFLASLQYLFRNIKDKSLSTSLPLALSLIYELIVFSLRHGSPFILVFCCTLVQDESLLPYKKFHFLISSLIRSSFKMVIKGRYLSPEFIRMVHKLDKWTIKVMLNTIDANDCYSVENTLTPYEHQKWTTILESKISNKNVYLIIVLDMLAFTAMVKSSDSVDIQNSLQYSNPGSFILIPFTTLLTSGENISYDLSDFSGQTEPEARQDLNLAKSWISTKDWCHILPLSMCIRIFNDFYSSENVSSLYSSEDSIQLAMVTHLYFSVKALGYKRVAIMTGNKVIEEKITPKGVKVIYVPKLIRTLSKK